MVALADATHYWKASEYSGSGTTWPDGIGSLDATLVGSPTWDGSKFTFNGTDQRAQIPDHADFDIGAAEAFSIVVVHAPVSLTDGVQVVFDVGLALSTASPGSWLAVISDGRHQMGVEDDGADSVARTNNLGSSDGDRIIVGGGLDRTNTQLWMFSPTDGTRRAGSSAAVDAITPANANGIAANNSGGALYAGDIWGVAYFHNVELTNAEVEAIGNEIAPAAEGNNLLLLGVG